MTEIKTLQERTFEKLDSMQVGDSFDKTEFIKELYRLPLGAVGAK